MLLLSMAVKALHEVSPLDLSRVVGNSMAPTLHDGQLFFIDREAYRYSPPAYGDVVVGVIDGDYHVKRVVGNEGERVWLWQDDRHEPPGAASPLHRAGSVSADPPDEKIEIHRRACGRDQNPPRTCLLAR